MTKKIEAFVKIIIGATFFAPLVLVSSKFVFPFIVPKILVFRGLTLLMLGAYILLLAIDWQKYRPRLTLINAAVGIFLLSFAISTFVGVDLYKSFWDNHERMLGLFTISHYVIYYFVITSVIKGWDDWKWLLRLFLFAGSVVMVIGVLQRINPEWLLNRGNSRVSATLGNPIYFSGYGLFVFYIGLILFWKELVNGWKYFAVIGGLLGFFGIFLGGTRGTVLGLIASVGIALLCYLFALKENKKARRTVGVLIIVGIAAFGLLFAFRWTDFVQRIPTLGRLFTVSLTSSTGATRILAWEIAIDAWKEKPVLGWGPNNYFYAFNKYYKPEFLERGWGETWFDNAHSVIFNTIAVQGVLGLLAYLALFAAPVYCLWHAYKRQHIGVHLAIIGVAFLVGHFVHNAVVFENPTSYLYFFFFLAFINSLYGYTDNPDLRITKNDDKIVSSGFAALVFLAVFILIYSTNINPARANMASLYAIKSLQTGLDVVGAYKKAADIPSPHIDDIRSDFVRSLILVIPQYIKAGLADKARELYVLGYEESKKNLILHPLDIRAQMQFAQLVQESVTELKESPQLMLEAEAVLKQALAISPKRQQISYQLAMLELQISNPEYAVSLLQKTIDDDPMIAEGWWRLALAYAHAGNNQKALETIKTAQDKGMQFDVQGQGVISMILAAGKTGK